MQSVGFSVVDVVETIDAAGYHAKSKKRYHAWPHIAPFGSMTAEEQGREYKDVLQPLMWPQQSDDVSIHFSS